MGLKWKCSGSGCALEFNTKISLRNHRKVFHSKSSAYVCTENGCNMTFAGFKAFKEHMSEVHNKRPLKCQECDQSFNDKAGLKVHTEAKHENGRNHTCDICGKKFTTARFMAHHRKEQHEEGEKRRIKCPECDVVSLGVRNLRKHRNTMHSEDLALFQCSYCSIKSKTRANLKVHEAIHRGEKPFKCNLCTKNFKRKQHLKNHLKSLHSKSSPGQTSSIGSSSQVLTLDMNTSNTFMETQVVEEMAVEYTITEGEVIIPADGVVYLQPQPSIPQFCHQQVTQ